MFALCAKFSSSEFSNVVVAYVGGPFRVENCGFNLPQFQLLAPIIGASQTKLIHFFNYYAYLNILAQLQILFISLHYCIKTIRVLQYSAKTEVDLFLSLCMNTITWFCHLVTFKWFFHSINYDFSTKLDEWFWILLINDTFFSTYIWMIDISHDKK